MRAREAVTRRWVILWAAAALGCAGTTTATAPTAGPPDTTAAPGPSAPGPAPAGSTVRSAPDATPLPAPALGGATPSRPVAPPPGSPSEAIRRDCGMSTALSGGRTLWIYCDTALFGADQRLQYFVNTSAAVASPEAPTVMQDHVDPDGHPLTFLRPEADYPRCASDEKPALWPQSAVTILAAGAERRDRVLIWYSNVCLVPGAARTADIGLAEARFDTGAGASAAPVAVDVLEPQVLPKLGPAGGYGVASVIEGPDAYLYWCGQDIEPCRVARVALDHATDRAAYRYFDGTGWVPDAAAARPLAMGESHLRIKTSVQRVEALGRYVMADVDAWNQVQVRVATRPEGPWSAPAAASLPECTQPYPNNCFAVEVQPQLSDGTQVTVSYFDPMRPYDLEPTTRVVQIPITFAP